MARSSSESNTGCGCIVLLAFLFFATFVVVFAARLALGFFS